jgi:DNA-3-methyladenine glycosylase II
MPRDVALSHLQHLPGIGPFSAELILMRRVGDPDAFPRTELRLQRAMAAAYGLGQKPDLAVLEKIADGWCPYRSWVGLLLRNAEAYR